MIIAEAALTFWLFALYVHRTRWAARASSLWSVASTVLSVKSWGKKIQSLSLTLRQGQELFALLLSWHNYLFRQCLLQHTHVRRKRMAAVWSPHWESCRDWQPTRVMAPARNQGLAGDHTHNDSRKLYNLLQTLYKVKKLHRSLAWLLKACTYSKESLHLLCQNVLRLHKQCGVHDPEMSLK